MVKINTNSQKPGREDRYDFIPRGKDYEPFIEIQDFGSLGRSHRPYGIKTGRKQDFLSDLEKRYFLILEFTDMVVDIREQFPLELKETRLIAEELGIKYPFNPKTNDVMTSDFCITIKDGNSMRDVIRTSKYKKELLDRRVIEKFEIEKTYWERHGLDWGIVTEEEIDVNYCQNVDDILEYYDLADNAGFREISLQEREDMIIELLQRLINSDKATRQVLSLFEKDLHLKKGAGIALFKHAIARNYISIDLFTPLDLEKNVRIGLLVKAREIGEVVS